MGMYKYMWVISGSIYNYSSFKKGKITISMNSSIVINLENLTAILEIVTRVCVTDAIESIHYGNFSICLRKVLIELHSLLHFMVLRCGEYGG